MTNLDASASARRILHLDGWRGISILLVLLGHFLPEMPVNLAALGVELFFVLSGRLMAEILFVERYPLPAFFRRRISRIVPAMVVFVLLTWAAVQGSYLTFKPLAAIMGMTFTLNYAMVFHHGVAAIENLWSLCIEEHAYLLLGLLAFFVRRRAWSARWIILAMACASVIDALISTLAFDQSYRQVYWRTDAHIASILLAASGHLFLRGRRVPCWIPVIALAGGAALWLAPDALSYSLGTALIAVAVCTLDRAPAGFRAALSWNPVVSLGLWSYSLYLWQQPFSRLQVDAVMPSPVALSLAIACGLVSFYFIEQPSRRWLNRHWRSWAPRLQNHRGVFSPSEDLKNKGQGSKNSQPQQLPQAEQ